MSQEPQLELCPMPRATAAPAAASSSPASRSASIGGPGWFDSSWELQRGLNVREGLPRDVSLAIWVDAFVGAQSPAADFGEGASLSAT